MECNKNFDHCSVGNCMTLEDVFIFYPDPSGDDKLGSDIIFFRWVDSCNEQTKMT